MAEAQEQETSDSESEATIDDAVAQGEVQVNEDGSITVGSSEQAAAPRKPSHRWVGPGVLPDAKYNDVRVAKFINYLMHDGKKSVAERVMYDAMEEIANKLKLDPLGVFHTALDNAMPMVEVKSKRVGGANYQVPVEVSRKRAQTLAIRWIADSVRSRKGRPTYEKLAQELIDCYNKQGATIQKRENTHRMAEANKAFSHFA